jgi:hypothetical protein
MLMMHVCRDGLDSCRVGTLIDDSVQSTKALCVHQVCLNSSLQHVSLFSLFQGSTHDRVFAKIVVIHAMMMSMILERAWILLRLGVVCLIRTSFKSFPVLSIEVAIQHQKYETNSTLKRNPLILVEYRLALPTSMSHHPGRKTMEIIWTSSCVGVGSIKDACQLFQSESVSLQCRDFFS